ncbi:TRAP transporter substrate-binding protein [Oceanivirga salmonicida]|uniref:TRAP transporter substrate-binding protein n=1 Tax=Oceanivirga salmonicida TaxID=1769291 RepID=UPI0009E7D21D|nr:TRAP transporter substrate-binding protein [Oceanivirga salmonicida]
MLLFCIFSCGKISEKRIIRIGHNQSETHPTHIGMLAFKKYIEKELGEKYEVQIFPNELLGSQNDMVQLTQTGAIDFVVASNAIMETFQPAYKIFNLPYLFINERSFADVMNDEKITESIYNSTKKNGFQVVTWLDAGVRSFYTIANPINTPEDLKGLKIRVQKSPTNIEMMKLLGGAATPMGFGEVYTALQSNILDGAENNELALTNNGHGDVAKYYSYDMHQIIPDLVLGNTKFLENLSIEEYQIFKKGFKIINEIERKEWKAAVEKAKKIAETKQGVVFSYPDISLFKKAVLPLHKKVLMENPELEEIYNKIQEKNDKYQKKEGN